MVDIEIMNYYVFFTLKILFVLWIFRERVFGSLKEELSASDSCIEDGRNYKIRINDITENREVKTKEMLVSTT